MSEVAGPIFGRQRLSQTLEFTLSERQGLAHGEETRHHSLHIAIDWRGRFAKRYRYDCSSRVRTNTG